ncbi:MAG: DUF2586 family protein, partial [Solimonas sp.]
MPVALSYPGVYVQEIPSGVRTITGVATSITAFVGRALRGPDDEPVTVNSYADFERVFGGISVDSSLGYAVRDFFLNGGGQAIVVRLYNAETGASAKPAKSKLTVGDFTFEAAHKGVWGTNLRATIDLDVSADVATGFGLVKADLFNLIVREVDATGATIGQEIIRNVSLKDSPRRIDKVLQSQSNLLRWSGSFPPNPLPALPAATTDDDVTKAEKALAAARAATPPVPATIAAAEAALAAARQALQASNGKALTKADNFTPANGQTNKKGLYALERADIFNLLSIPPYT